MTNMSRVGLLCAASLLPAIAYAQDTARPDTSAGLAAATGADAGVLEDIVVTARKTSEKLQDVPVAITAFSSAEIKSARIERLSDLAKLTPGLIFTPLFGRQNQLPIIRGAAQTLGQLNVGVFIDGIYLSGKGGVDTELNDLERVEVVKGPQSALYGRNTFSGAINYVTKAPASEFGGNVEAGVGTDNLYKVQASITGPINDKIRFRLGGFYRSFDGWYKSAIDGGKVDFEESYGALATVEFQPVEQFTATFRASYSKSDDGQPPSSIVRTNAFPGTPSGGSATQPRNLLFVGELPSLPRNGITVNTRDVPGLPGGSYGDREKTVRASATFEYDFGNVMLTSITSFSRRDAEFTFDGDNTVCDRTGGCPNFGFPFAPAIPFGKSDFALSSNDGFLRDLSQELRLASTGNEKFDWLVGIFRFDNRTSGFDRGITIPGALAITDYSAAAAAYRYPKQVFVTKATAVFGSATWHATERFSVIGELRYEYESQTFEQSPLRTGTTGSLAVFDLEQHFDFVTPRLILNYKPSDDALVYASYARGAKTGGFNGGLNIFADQRTYQPEYADNYEIGLKTDLLDQKLRLNIAAFYIDWKDQQAACQNPAALFPGASSTNRTYQCNVAASQIYGTEIEVAARFSDWFSLSGNYAYTHARYDRFIDDSLRLTLASLGQPNVDFNGKSLPYVPDHKFVVTPRFNVDVGSYAVEARADLQYQSRTFVRADNLQNFGEKTNVDLRLTVSRDALSLQLWGNNVFDNKRPVAAVRFFDSVNYSVAAPLVTGANRRQIGATLGYRF